MHLILILLVLFSFSALAQTRVRENVKQVQTIDGPASQLPTTPAAPRVPSPRVNGKSSKR